MLIVGLLRVLKDRKGDSYLAHRDALLDELRALARSYPDDVNVRRLLSMLQKS
jgi:hypothetical protein